MSKKRRGKAPELYDFQGEQRSVREISALTGMSRRVVYSRLKNGAPLDEPRIYDGNAVKKITFNGETDTVRNWARRTGLNVRTLHNRLKRGHSVEEALTLPTNNGVGGTPYYITFRGITDTLSGWARRIGMPACTLRDRVLQRGWSIERALTEPVMITAVRHQRTVVLKRMIGGFHHPSPPSSNPAVAA